MTEHLEFKDMTGAEMIMWAQQNPTRLNDRDARGNTLLFTAAGHMSTAMVEWLVDEKGADIHSTTETLRIVGLAPARRSISRIWLLFTIVPYREMHARCKAVSFFEHGPTSRMACVSIVSMTRGSCKRRSTQLGFFCDASIMRGVHPSWSRAVISAPRDNKKDASSGEFEE
jgi:hypothetical protein